MERNKKTLLKGIPGSPGRAKGKVKIILTPADFSKFQRGEILVAEATNPVWTPLIFAAKAVITDRGGALSHAAIVAREYGIPAVVGTKTATRDLTDDQEAEVDGKRGIVYI